MCLNAGANGRQDAESETLIPTSRGGFFDGDVAHALRGEGFDASEDGTGRGTPLRRQEDDANIVAFDLRGREGGSQFEGTHETANIRAGSGGSSRSYVAEQWAVRRLMPVECERLQAFEDDYTAIPFRGKLATDGPRYKALGNSMAVNVMRWLGRRIDLVRSIPSHPSRTALDDGCGP